MNRSRRTILSNLAAVAATGAFPRLLRGQYSPIRRYLDASTEIEILCLSDPAQAAFLPFSCNRSNSSRQGFVIYSMEGTQGPQAYRLELKGGVLKPLTTASAMHPRALALSPDDKTLYFTDGDRLLATSAQSLAKPRELHRASSPSAWSNGFSLSEDGSSLSFIDNGNLMLLSTRSSSKPTAQSIAEISQASRESLATKGNVILFRDQDNRFQLYAPELGNKPKRLPCEGNLGPAVWNPDGRSFLFLRTKQGPGIANSLHEYSLDTQRESLVGKTSQFASFHRNGDSSVFVGASSSKAQPYILLMLRITRRELALCEHKASDAEQVSPVFSPSSKRIFFQSDRLGKSAIFSVAVERLVEATENDEAPKKT